MEILQQFVNVSYPHLPLPFRSDVHGGADFHSHLPVVHLSFVDTAPRLNDLEPAQVLGGFVRPSNGPGNRLLNGDSRGAGELDEFINVVFHAMGWKAKLGPRMNPNVFSMVSQ
jgi:hypothetical protein